MIAETESGVFSSGFKKHLALIAAGLAILTLLVLAALTSPGIGLASANSGALVIDDFGCWMAMAESSTATHLTPS